MSPHRRHRTGRTWPGVVGVGVVMALVGVLFTTNARLSADDGGRHASDLRQLVTTESKHVSETSQHVEQLSNQIDSLAEKYQNTTGIAKLNVPESVQLASGRLPVRGPGIKVQLNDAPSGSRADGIPADSLVVHQQDVEAVINALWSGGAEAIMVQDQRLSSTSAIRCVGNVLLLHGQAYSPPYTIAAIGNQQKMNAALMDSADVQTYLEWVHAVGLGWSVSMPEAISMPAFDGAATSLKYAQVPPGALDDWIAREQDGGAG